MSAAYQSANGERHEGAVVNLGSGGLFIQTPAPLAIGKRISVELVVAGEAAPGSALGRVVWARTAAEGPAVPAGMGVKLIDLDESVAQAIAQIVGAREPTEPGLGDGGPASAPSVAGAGAAVPRGFSRERTSLGLGTTTLGLGMSNAVDRVSTPEPTLAIDLVARKSSDAEPTSTQEAPSLPPPRRSPHASRALAIFALVGLLVAVAYALRDRFPEVAERVNAALAAGLRRLQ